MAGKDVRGQPVDAQETEQPDANAGAPRDHRDPSQPRPEGGFRDDAAGIAQPPHSTPPKPKGTDEGGATADVGDTRPK